MTEAGEITARTAVAFLLATWPRRVVLSLLLLVPIVVALAGGFRTAEPPPRAVPADAVTDTGAYLVVPHSYFVSDLVDAYGLEEGEQWVGVLAQITHQGTEPIGVTFSDRTFQLTDAVPVQGSTYPTEVLRLDTGRYLGNAQPGLTYEVALLWRASEMEQPPAELTLVMNQTWWRPWVIEAGTHTWDPTGRSFDVTLPLTEAPPSILEEDEE